MSRSESQSQRLPRAVEMSHRLLEERRDHLSGGRVVDGTVGNGHDTVFLARLVGPEGRVLGFDLQAEAIAATRARLEAADLNDRVELFEECHGDLGAHVSDPVEAAIFNLGYLPGSNDKAVITRPETTLAALEAVVERLSPGGLLVVVVYPGHPGGDEEAREVEAWATGLPQEAFTAVCYRHLNQANSPPFLVAIERR